MASISSTPLLDRVLLAIRDEFDSNNAEAVAREASCYRIISVAAIVFSVASIVAVTTLQEFSIAWLAVPAVSIVICAISYKAFQCVTIVYQRSLLDTEPSDKHRWMDEVKREVLSFPFFDSVAEYCLKKRVGSL